MLEIIWEWNITVGQAGELTEGVNCRKQQCMRDSFTIQRIMWWWSVRRDLLDRCKLMKRTAYPWVVSDSVGITGKEVTGDSNIGVETLAQELRKYADRFLFSLLLHNVCFVYWWQRRTWTACIIDGLFIVIPAMMTETSPTVSWSLFRY
jgi:hypothetical protein